jgi:hypothetical protein
MMTTATTKTEAVRTAFGILARAKVLMQRAAKNWTRDGAGDEEVARRYWAQADVLRFRAQSYLSEHDYIRVSCAVSDGATIETTIALVVGGV